MRIHDFPLAPNPRRLRIYLAEKGIEVPFQMVDLLAGEHRSEAYRAKNPLGLVPVLELDDGTYLTESLAIIEYLEELHPDPPMIGRTPLERARVRCLERVAELGVLAKVGRYVHNTRSPLPGRVGSKTIADAMRAELPEALAVLDDALDGRDFLAGDAPTIADCTLYVSPEFARFADLDLFEGYERLIEWQSRMQARPSTKVPSLG